MARQFSPASTEKLYGVSPTKVRKVPQDSGHLARLRLLHSPAAPSPRPSCPMHSDDPQGAPRLLVLLAC